MGKRIPELYDGEWLRQQYVVHGKADRIIAQELGCAQTTVICWRHKHGIEARKRFGKESSAWRGGPVTYTCDECGAAFTRPVSYKPGRHVFCSNACAGACLGKERAGSANPSWKGGLVACTCAECGATLMREPNHVARNKRHFCDHGCYGAWHGKHRRGANGSNWRGGLVECKCEWCGLQLARRPSLARGHNFCSHKCHGAWQKENRAGKDSHNWRGDATNERRRWQQHGGKEWARACRKRDEYTCQRCGKVFEKHSSSIHVHHKAPFADYPSLRCEERNGMCLCKECHWWMHSNEGELVRLRWELDAVHELLLNVAS
jgi:hypothetical protein